MNVLICYLMMCQPLSSPTSYPPFSVSSALLAFVSCFYLKTNAGQTRAGMSYSCFLQNRTSSRLLSLLPERTGCRVLPSFSFFQMTLTLHPSLARYPSCSLHPTLQDHHQYHQRHLFLHHHRQRHHHHHHHHLYPSFIPGPKKLWHPSPEPFASTVTQPPPPSSPPSPPVQFAPCYRRCTL